MSARRLLVLVLAILFAAGGVIACSSKPRPRAHHPKKKAWTVEPRKVDKRKPPKAKHGKHEHGHGTHPHDGGGHHHHPHPHPHLEGADGHHHAF